MVHNSLENREPTIFNSLLILFFVSLILFLSLLYRQNNLSRLAILVLVVIVGAKAWSIRSNVRISCYSNASSRCVFPGESVTLATTVANDKWLPIWLKILWSFDRTLNPVGEKAINTRQETAVLWHQIVHFQQQLAATRRGVYRVGPPRIRTGDFLGFFENEKRDGDAIELVVYPRLVPLKAFVLQRRDLFGIPGARSPVKDPIYILGTRDYQPTSPARHIHWKASARHLRLQEKIFEPSEQARILLTLDVKSFAGSAQPQCFEQTLEVLASLAAALDRRRYAVGFVANGVLQGTHPTVLPPARGQRQIQAILEALARMQPEPDGSIEQKIAQFPGSQRGITCFYFCYDDRRLTAAMARFFRLRQMAVTFMVARDERTSALSPYNKILDRHWIDEIRIDRHRQL